ncbi:MAG: CRTAC1 family protein [Bacteroidota bacterium]
MGFFRDYSHLISDNPARKHYGIAITDMDFDGQPEAFITGFAFPNQVLKWNGHAFIDVAPPLLADPHSASIGVAAADIDQDGKEEIYVLNTDTFAGEKRFSDKLFTYGQEWVDLFSLEKNHEAINPSAGRSVIAVDRIGRGRYGFYLANYGGAIRFYEQDHENRLMDIASLIGLDYQTGGRSAVSLPILSSQMDIYAGNEWGPNYFFQNQGDGTYLEIAAELGLSDEKQHARGIYALDANGNGKIDLVCSNWEGYHKLFVQEDNAFFQDRAIASMASPSKVRTVIAADFDNDGYEEIFFNNIGEPNRLFKYMENSWVKVDIGQALEPFGHGTGAAVADLDGDGVLELLISHGESSLQPLSLFKAEAPANKYLRIQPLTPAGAPARGALIKLYQPGRTQIRTIDSGSGYLCQMEAVAHFGLGNSTEIERIEIFWPDGKKLDWQTDQLNTLHRVAYPG